MEIESQNKLIKNYQKEKQIWINYALKIKCPTSFKLKEYKTIHKNLINYKKNKDNLYVKIINEN